jgi:hypothetical protein
MIGWRVPIKGTLHLLLRKKQNPRVPPTYSLYEVEIAPSVYDVSRSSQSHTRGNPVLEPGLRGSINVSAVFVTSGGRVIRVCAGMLEVHTS